MKNTQHIIDIPITNNGFEKTALLRRLFASNINNPEILANPHNIGIIMSFAVTKEIIKLCARIKPLRFSVPWKNSANYQKFIKAIGNARRRRKLKTLAVYVLKSKSGRTYVGRSKHVARRIRDHFLGQVPRTSSILEDLRHPESEVIIYPIDPETIKKAEKLGLTPGFFLVLLELYCIIIHQADVNKLLVPHDTSDRRPPSPVDKTSLERTMESTTRIELFCYQIINGCFILIYIAPRISRFANMAKKSKNWMNKMVHKQNGNITENFIISLTPIENSVEALIDSDTFQTFLGKHIPLSKNQFNIFLHADNSDVVEGPFSINQLMSIIGLERKILKNSLNTNDRFLGYYFKTKSLLIPIIFNFSQY